MNVTLMDADNVFNKAFRIAQCKIYIAPAFKKGNFSDEHYLYKSNK